MQSQCPNHAFVALNFDGVNFPISEKMAFSLFEKFLLVLPEEFI
jgi:hypothetical protein